MADALFGKIDPGGKLPMSFPRNVGQIPISYNELPTGRPPTRTTSTRRSTSTSTTHRSIPFGYGLSYTTFSLSNLHLSSSHIGRNGSVTVSGT